MLDGQECGVLGLSSGRVEGFLGMCVGLYVFFLGCTFFLSFLDLLSFLVWGPHGF